jgi:hypothetical protein
MADITCAFQSEMILNVSIANDCLRHVAGRVEAMHD